MLLGWELGACVWRDGIAGCEVVRGGLGCVGEGEVGGMGEKKHNWREEEVLTLELRTTIHQTEDVIGNEL